jgi:hypothetical protein
MITLKGGRAAIAIRLKLGRTISTFPPMVELPEADLPRVVAEGQICAQRAGAKKTEHAAGRHALAREATLLSEVAELRAKVDALLSGGAAPAGDLRLKPGAIWLSKYNERSYNGKIKEASENIFEIDSVEEDTAQCTILTNGGRKTQISLDTLTRYVDRYICIRSAGAGRFTFPEEK